MGGIWLGVYRIDLGWVEYNLIVGGFDLGPGGFDWGWGGDYC